MQAYLNVVLYYYCHWENVWHENQPCAYAISPGPIVCCVLEGAIVCLINEETALSSVETQLLAVHGHI